MNPARRRRRHRTRAEKQQLVQDWIASGRSSRAFAMQANLCASNLWRWKRELAGDVVTSLVPIVVGADSVPASPSDPSPSPQLEVVGRGGRVVRVFAGCDQGLLRAVLAVAEENAPC